jgi:heterodisulfide reductase subunit B
MKLAYYNSCSLRTTGKEYDQSLRMVFDVLGIELIEVSDWLCCGSTIAHNISQLLALSLPLKNLAEVEKMGFHDLVVPCTACYNRFKVAQFETEEDPNLKAEIEEIIEYRFEQKVNVLHPLEVLSSEEILSKIKELKKKDLSHIKTACYYGCLLIRPPKATKFEGGEYPMSMDNILKAAGISVLDWSHKTDCCGASLSITKPEIVTALSGKVLKDAKAVGANAVSVPCTFCQLNLDVRQDNLKKNEGFDPELPIFYFTELLSLALGIAEKDLMLSKHFVSTSQVLEKVTG